jgi:hypothetical protein
MKRIILLFSLFLSVYSYGQFNYLAANAVNTTGTYTDLGVNGTAIVTNSAASAMTYDDDNSSVQNIGFNFVYNGTTFTQFVLNSNGFIKLGATAPATAGIYDPNASTETNLISPLAMDLDAGTSTPEYRVYISGSAGSRVCTIQFKNVQDWAASAGAGQYTNINFQIKLYETSNNIEFVYGTFTATATASAVLGAVAGVKGTDATASVNATKASSSAYSAATFINGNYTGNKFNNRNSVLPPVGTTLRFVAVALAANDAQAVIIYTLPKLPLTYGSPHIVKAIVKNAGANALTNLGVTLNITGANTFTNTQNVASLASGASATVSFAAFVPTTNGTNTVTVSVPSDDNNANNSVNTTQLVNNIAFSYADNSAVTSSVGYNTGSGIIADKYTIQGSGYVTNVKVFIGNDAATTGNTVYAVVLDAAGTIIGQSSNYTVLAGDLNAFKTFTINTPPNVSNADFYVGLAQTANTLTGYFPVGTQVENIIRSGAYYTAPLAGGAAPAENTTIGRFVVEALVSATSTPTPLTLAAFNGKIINSSALLTWSTSTEVNTDKFEVEKTTAANNSAWSTIATLAAAGNSNSTKSYQITDAGLTVGKYLYRLKMIDKDGKYTYSNIISLELAGKNQFVLNQNYPNPVKGSTQISYQLNAEAKVVIELFTQDGRKVASLINQQQTAGTYNFSVYTKQYGLATGNYSYRMTVIDNNNQELYKATKTMIVVQ